MATEGLEQAFATTRAVVAQVTPDQYDAATPCDSWDVRALINHIVGGSYFFGASMSAGKAPDSAPETDFTEGDVLAAYDGGIKLSLDAFGAPGALEKMVELPFGTFPGGAFLGLAMTDTLTHGWDLAPRHRPGHRPRTGSRRRAARGSQGVDRTRVPGARAGPLRTGAAGRERRDQRRPARGVPRSSRLT